MSLNYKLNVTIEPMNIKRGSKIAIKVEFSAIKGNVKYAMVKIVNSGMITRLKPIGNNVFSSNLDIPAFVPRGFYDIAVYGIDDNQIKGPAKEIRVRVI